MAERKIWTPQEDNVLKEIILVRKVKKWSAIARCMVNQYKMYGRTGKQCRERWHNQLDPNINNEQWTREEEEILFQCHNQFGNKWAKIAIRLPGRTDNNIKNHFYSTLRKGIRKLNKTILENTEKGAFKQFKGPILSKLITVAEDKFDHKLSVSEELRDKCVAIKIKLIDLSKDEVEAIPQQCVRLAKSIVDFNRSFRKRKSKKRKNQSDEDDDTIMSSDEKQKEKPKEKQKEKQKQRKSAPHAPFIPILPVASIPIFQSKPPPSSFQRQQSRIELNLLRIDKSNHQQEDIIYGQLPILKKNSSSYIIKNSPLMTYRLSQPMLDSIELGGPSSGPMVSLDSSTGIKDLFYNSTPIKNLFGIAFGGDDSQNLFPQK